MKSVLHIILRPETMYTPKLIVKQVNTCHHLLRVKFKNIYTSFILVSIIVTKSNLKMQDLVYFSGQLSGQIMYLPSYGM